MDNINEVIKKYADFYSGRPYVEIADRILESELNIKATYSHRTLRRKISEYVNSKNQIAKNLEWLEDIKNWSPSKNQEDSRAEEYCCGKVDTCESKCEFKNQVKAWSKEDTVDYFKNVEDKKLNCFCGCGGTPCIEDTVYQYPPLVWEKEYKLQPYVGGNPDNVLVISDTQFPFEREGALEHCRAVQEKYDCGTVVHIGDVKDSHASSFHTSDVDGYSAGDELTKTIERTKEWHRVFPNVKVTLGNHDLIILRKAMAAGLSSKWIKGLAEVLETPTWEYATEFIINGTMYTHTLGANALQAALLRQVNLVVGHEHSKAKIEYAASLDKLFWAMNVGALVDDRKYAFAYAKTAPKKSVVSCGVVIGNIPHLIPMSL